MNKYGENISDAAQDTADKVKDGAQDAYNKAADKVNDVADKVSKKSEELMDSKVLQECSSWVRDNPVTAVVMAAGIGVVLSKMSR